MDTKIGEKRQKNIDELFQKQAKTAKTTEDNTDASASVSSAGISSPGNLRIRLQEFRVPQFRPFHLPVM